MAATTLGNSLTRQQRQLQLQLRALTLRDLTQVWRLLSPTELDRTWPGVQTAIERIAETRQPQSVQIASRYLRQFRTAEGVSGDLDVVPAVLDTAALRTSLTVTGYATIKRLTTVGSVQQATDTAFTRVAGAVGRHVLDGGRFTIDNTTQADRRALGWARATSGRACAFCAMLASRGPVYRGQDTASFETHDNCACTVEPVYSRTAAWPANSRRYQQLWQDYAGDQSGADARNAFRRALSEAEQRAA